MILITQTAFSASLLIVGCASFAVGVFLTRLAMRREVAWYRRNAGRLFIRCRELEHDQAE